MVATERTFASRRYEPLDPRLADEEPEEEPDHDDDRRQRAQNQPDSETRVRRFLCVSRVVRGENQEADHELWSSRSDVSRNLSSVP